MPRLRPRGPEPGLGRRVRVVALPAFPGLGVTATFVPGTAIAAELDAPGLDVSAIPTGYDITASLAFPGLAVSALCRAGTQAAATVAFPGLTTRADFFAALAAMPSLDVPRAIAGGPGLGAQPVFPGLSVPTADVRAILLVPLAATVAAPGLGVTAAVTPPAGQFRLAPDYTIDWATLRAPIPAPSSVVQIGLPVSNGVRISGHTGGPESTGNVALASKNKSGPGWSGAFTLKRTDAFAPASGGGAAFLILYFGAVGDGTAGFPADIAQWPGGTEPYSAVFAAHITGARLTFFFNNNALGVDPPASAPALAVFNADGSVTAIAADNPSTVLNQARNFPFDYTLALSTASPPVLTLTQHDASVPTDRTITWTNALLATRASPSQGSFVWLCTPGRVAEITAESFTPPVTPQPSATVVLPGLDLIPKPQVDVGAGGTGFPNGYAAVRRLVRSAQADLAAESTADLPSFIDTTEIPGDWSFLVVANGALLSSTGHVLRDVRFETEGGTKLDHQVVSWDDAGGTARFFVREPAASAVDTGATSDTDLRVLLYYGKAGLSASEERIAQVWRATAQAVDPTTGIDLAGKATTMTRANVGTTTLDGRPAATFTNTTTSKLSRSAAPGELLDGLPAFTEEVWGIVDGSGSGSINRLGGTSLSAEVHSRWESWTQATGTGTGKTSCFEDGQNWTPTGGGPRSNQSTESRSGLADGTTLRHLFFIRDGNTATRAAMYDGEDDISTTTGDLGSPIVGTIKVETGDVFEIGASSGQGQPKAAAMTIGLDVIWPKALSATWRAMLDRTQRDSSLCWAVGAEDLPAGDKSPVGRSWRDSITAQTDYTAASHAYDPDAGAILAVTAVTPNADLFAAYSIPPGTGKLRVAPISGGQPGVGRPVVTLSDGTKTAKVKPYISISGVVVPPSGYYKTPNIAGKTARTAANRAALITLVGQFANGTYSTSSSYIEITGAITGSDFAINADGTRAHPLVIMSSFTNPDDWTSRSGKKIKDIQITVNGDWVWWYGCYFEVIPTVRNAWGTDSSQLGFSLIFAGAHDFATACRFTNSRAINTNNFNDTPTANFNWFEMATQSASAVGAGDDAWRSLGSGAPAIVQNLTFARNKITQYANAVEMNPKGAAGVYFGNGVVGVHNAPGCKIEYNYINFNFTRAMEFKYAPDFVRWNHIIGPGYAGINFRGESAVGGEVSYNRIVNAVNCMVEGKRIYNSNWMIDGSGNPSGTLNLFSHLVRISGVGKEVASADGSVLVGNKCNVQLVYDFEIGSNYNYSEDLGSTDDILFADHLGGAFTDLNGGTVNFIGGVATGPHPHVRNSGIKKQTAIPSGYTVAVPPVLDGTVCGPAAAGLTWP